jgi:hypothetical protein
MLKPLDELNLLLIEQPLDEDDLWDHSQLQKEFRTPICLDESILSRRHARQAIEMQACRIINIKAGRVGGLSQALAIHNLCRDNSIPVWCGGMLETGVGRASNLALAALPGFSLPGDISASNRYYKEDITHQEFTLNADSTIDVPEGVVLGITVDQERLARVERASLKLPDPSAGDNAHFDISLTIHRTYPSGSDHRSGGRLLRRSGDEQSFPVKYERPYRTRRCAVHYQVGILRRWNNLPQ